MSDQQPGMSDAFRAFMHEAFGHAEAWMGAVRGLDAASALERVMNSIRNRSGMRKTGYREGPGQPEDPHPNALFTQVHNTL